MIRLCVGIILLVFSAIGLLTSLSKPINGDNLIYWLEVFALPGWVLAYFGLRAMRRRRLIMQGARATLNAQVSGDTTKKELVPQILLTVARNLVHSLVIGVIGGGIGRLWGQILGADNSSIGKIAGPWGFLSGFTLCFFLSLVYLKRTKQRTAEKKTQKNLGVLFGATAGAMTAIITETIGYGLGEYKLQSLASLLNWTIHRPLDVFLDALLGAAVGATVALIIFAVYPKPEGETSRTGRDSTIGGLPQSG